LVKSAQEFPDDKYTVKLGTQRETRTFAARKETRHESRDGHCDASRN
jgi:hypothetical protein